MTNALGSFHELAGQLDSTPNAPAVLDTVRRELHRIHGSGGTFGFSNASAVAREMEQRAIDWVADPMLDRAERGHMLRQFAVDLNGALERDESSTDSNSDSSPSPTAASLPSAASARETTAEATPHDVVVVEDDQALSDMLRFALESNGFTVQTFLAGPDALNSLLSNKSIRPTLVLLDIDLPGIDGHSIHERLRVQRPGKYAIVFMSARASEAEQLRAFKAGAIDYLVKPTSLRILLAKVPVWLGMIGYVR